MCMLRMHYCFGTPQWHAIRVRGCNNLCNCKLLQKKQRCLPYRCLAPISQIQTDLEGDCG